ncbi:chemotaxis protein CheC [Natribacillus halophilus]|uniref:Chemotaxis protein CheC n=1 Tax=Natribacillus halophilus TaxID=549003 RepID=A0A1G8PPH4_9BACI|nr:chemotaxis protein CheC [Natribacillus halophilus]SDI94228.1 chemotaxis protein CheC [Natribacillus halophilus]
MLDLTAVEMDQLKEISSIGFGHAATALSELLQKRCKMTVPAVDIVAFDEVVALAGGPENVVAAIFLKIEGPFRATILFVLPAEQASGIVRQLTGQKSDIDEETGLSALNEFGNIIAGTYVATFADMTKLDVRASIPASVIDMAGAVLTPGLLPLSVYGDEVILLQTDFNDEKRLAQFYLLPEPGSVDVLRQVLKGLSQ